jgi:hypothetical protein
MGRSAQSPSALRRRKGETFWNEMRKLWRDELARHGKGMQA